MTIVVLHNVGNDKGNLVLYHDTYNVWPGGVVSDRKSRVVCECDPKNPECQAQNKNKH